MLLIMMMMMDDSADGNDEEVPLGGSLNQTWSPPSHQSSPGGHPLPSPRSLNLKQHPINTSHTDQPQGKGVKKEAKLILVFNHLTITILCSAVH